MRRGNQKVCCEWKGMLTRGKAHVCSVNKQLVIPVQWTVTEVMLHHLILGTRTRYTGEMDFRRTCSPLSFHDIPTFPPCANVKALCNISESCSIFSVSFRQIKQKKRKERKSSQTQLVVISPPYLCAVSVWMLSFLLSWLG